MISIAICDDSIAILESMKKMLKRYSVESEEIRISTFHSGNSLIENYCDNFDIIFLDIKMPGVSGIETAEKIRERDDKVTLIFLTSLLGHALDGYAVRAMNYLIKPLSYNRLKIEIDKWCSNIRDKEEPYITISNDDGNYKVLLKSISYIETYNRNLLVHTEKENIVCYKKLKVLENELKMLGFARCHSSFIVNLLYVEKVQKYEIVLVTLEKIPISQTKKKQFMEYLADYWGKSI